MEQPQQRGQESRVRPFRYDATDLRGKRMRLTYDAGHPQEALLGASDVICIDDTPNTLHDLRVHCSVALGTPITCRGHRSDSL